MNTTSNQVSFETQLGWCGLRWSERGITSVYLPGSRSIGEQASEAAADVPPFVARAIAAGTTRSYGDVARAMGLDRPDGAPDVGAALARNPTPIIVPCHRVVAANGALHGFSAPGGLATKRRMLELEGAPGYGQQVLFG